MAKYPYEDQALAALFNADATLTAADFNKLAGLDATAENLNLLYGLSAPGNATASKALVTDANNALVGLRRSVTADADGGPLTAGAAQVAPHTRRSNGNR